MPSDITNYKVFISSPSDVNAERDIVQEAIEQINQINGSRESFHLTPIRWEKDVSSQIGGHPQDIINHQVGDDYDIFIGILCNRFGQRTSSYESGTEEEFFRAYDRHIKGGDNIEILFYFKDPRRSELPIDINQLSKVVEFKEKLGGIGVYEEFETLEGLKTIVVAAIIKALDRLRRNVVKDKPMQKVEENSYIRVSENALVPISEFDEDIGLIELSELAFSALESFTENLQTITTATSTLGERITSRTEELNEIKYTGDSRSDQKLAKAVIEKVALEMQRYSHRLDQIIPDAKREFSYALRCMQHAVIIANQDGVSTKEDVEFFSSELRSLQLILTNVATQINSFKDSISEQPRMTSKLNQARRRAVKSVSDLVKFIGEASGNIDVTLDAIS